MTVAGATVAGATVAGATATTTTTAPDSRKPQFFLAYQPELFAVGHPRLFLRTVLVVLPLALLLCWSRVSQVTGIAPAVSLTILGIWTAWLGIGTLVLGPRFQRSRAAFFLAANGNLFMCIGTALALVLATGNPSSPLWLGYVVYACINGTIPTRHGRRFLLLCHVLSPFLLTAVFVHSGLPLALALPGPALAAMFSFIGFAYLTAIADVGLGLQGERDEALALLREREGELERQRIARELHDSLGSTLGLVGMYADLVERHVNDPAELRRVSSVVREAANEGLHDLRAVLNALAPHSTSFGTLTRALSRLAQRASTLAGADVSVTPAGDVERLVPGSVRLAIVRCVQEGVRNALRHGAAKHVQVRLALEANAACLELEDDGAGLAPQPSVPSPSRLRPGAQQDGEPEGLGLAGMRTRAEELGGSFEVLTAASGTRLRVRLPLSRDFVLLAPTPAGRRQPSESAAR
jgi:signal transduction histidine kinase